MNWEQEAEDYDPDTKKILGISVYFLIRFFFHPQNTANSMLSRFIEDHKCRFDEDYIHHQSSYRVAAIVHYLYALNGDPQQAGDWLVESGHNRPPRDAEEYFRQHYYKK